MDAPILDTRRLATADLNRKRRRALEQWLAETFSGTHKILPLDESIARAAARLEVRLGKQGRRIEQHDLWIAATALHRDGGPQNQRG